MPGQISWLFTLAYVRKANLKTSYCLVVLRKGIVMQSKLIKKEIDCCLHGFKIPPRLWVVRVVPSDLILISVVVNVVLLPGAEVFTESPASADGQCDVGSCFASFSPCLRQWSQLTTNNSRCCRTIRLHCWMKSKCYHGLIETMDLRINAAMVLCTKHCKIKTENQWETQTRHVQKQMVSAHMQP